MTNIKYIKQDFQEDAVNAICDVFNGEAGGVFRKQLGTIVLPNNQKTLSNKVCYRYGFENNLLSLSDTDLLKNIVNIQNRKYKDLSCGILLDEIATKVDKNNLNLTIEMETGTGKTYTYINTIYELNKRYNWTKFIIVVPSVAIREGVNSAFEDLKDHFKSQYNGKIINYFIFDSQKDKNGNNLTRNFTEDDDINVMIMNVQAINRFKKEKIDVEQNKSKVNNIYQKLEGSLYSGMEYIRGANPIVIIDEPQSVEGKHKSNKGRLAIKNELNSLFTIRYSATHLEKYTMMYRLDAIDAFNKKLVKKIEINGLEVENSTMTHGYFKLVEIVLSKGNPKAKVEIQNPNSKKEIRVVSENDNIYIKCSKLEQYRDWVIDHIDVYNRRIIIRTPVGDKVFYEKLDFDEPEEKFKRRIQIRETIKSHLDKEILNYKNGIKTLSLFFIDAVKKYKEYDKSGIAVDGEYAKYFVEEYKYLVDKYTVDFPEMKEYWENLDVDRTHQGYFSIDKKKKQFKSETKDNDVDVFKEIMANKKGLIDLDNPTRFIFSHSALKEGWDNPNVFQICILRDYDTNKDNRRQELGRGLRLCVDHKGNRIDSNNEKFDFNKINILTVIANESYEVCAKELQDEYARDLINRPTKITFDFLKTQKLNDELISPEIASEIHRVFRNNNYLELDGSITDNLKTAVSTNSLQLDLSIEEFSTDIYSICEKVISNTIKKSENSKQINKKWINLKLDKINDPDFKKLWNYINTKTYFTVNFDSSKLIEESKDEIKKRLDVSDVYIKSIKKIIKDRLENGELEFKDSKYNNISEDIPESLVLPFISDNLKIDLIGNLVDRTRLTKKTIISILKGIKDKFKLYLKNPEEFIRNISDIINDKKRELITLNLKNNIHYHKTDKKLNLGDIFKDSIQVNENCSLKTPNNNLYDYLEYDSKTVEKPIGEWADKYPCVKIFGKIPKNKYNIPTPTDNFSPDWLFVFKEGTSLYTYCVFESKSKPVEFDDDRRPKENWKIICARKHFEAISDENFKFEVIHLPVDIRKLLKKENYESLKSKDGYIVSDKFEKFEY